MDFEASFDGMTLLKFMMCTLEFVNYKSSCMHKGWSSWNAMLCDWSTCGLECPKMFECHNIVQMCIVVYICNNVNDSSAT